MVAIFKDTTNTIQEVDNYSDSLQKMPYRIVNIEIRPVELLKFIEAIESALVKGEKKFYAYAAGDVPITWQMSNF